MKKMYIVSSSQVLIGRSCICDISFADNEYISSSHLEICKSDIYDEIIMHGKNGGYVADVFLRRGDKKKIEYGDSIKLPDISILWLHDAILIGTKKNSCKSTFKEINTDKLECSGLVKDWIEEKGGLHKISKTKHAVLSYPMTMKPIPINNDPIELEPPPEKRVEDPQGIILTIGPAFTMAIPMIIGFIITYMAGKSAGGTSQTFMYTGLITAISSATFGSIWAGLNIKNRQKTSILKEQNRQQAYYKYVQESERKIQDRYTKNRTLIMLANPPLADMIQNISSNNNSCNLRLSDESSVLVRLGTGRVESNIKINIPKEKFSLIDDNLKSLPQTLKEKYKYFYDAPICVDLNRHNVIGIIDENITSIYHTLMMFILSLSLTFSPADLKIALIIKNSDLYKRIIHNLIFIPHIWKNDCALIGNRIEDVPGLFENTDFTKMVVITDCFYDVNHKSRSMNTVSSDKESYYVDKKVIYIIPSDNFHNLPDSCNAVIQKEQQFNGLIYLDDSTKKRQEIFFDSINGDLYKKYICKIAAVNGVSNIVTKEIPRKIGLHKVHNIINVTNEIISNMWNTNSCLDSISTPIGISECDEIVCLDFHEKRCGPHGIISGMTGSGKSEMLQTIIIGLAMRYHPNNVSFFLIDYKGGGMSMMFEGLPHVKGSISNLAGSTIRRAISSIKTENEIRQKMFTRVKVNNIYDYQRLCIDDKSMQPIPHLFIIVDEFAELKREQPDFIKDLISVSRVGRSLGIHLILATQKPAGVIDDNILSNSRFRICLKVQDKMDSKELLGKYDAAYITNPGRAYLQVGNDEIYKEFQSAYTMTPCHGKKQLNNNVTFISEIGKPLFEDEDVMTEDNSVELEVVKECIYVVAEQCNDICSQKMWLDPLPEKIPLIDSTSKDSNESLTKADYRGIRILKYDSVARREQNDFYHDFLSNGNLLILGGVASGKTNLLKVISYEIITQYNSSFYNLYFLDFGSGRLKIFEKSNHCGGYFSEDNIDDIEKLFIMIEDVVSERKKLLNGIDFSKFHSNNASLPIIVIFIDGIGSFREKTGSMYDATLLNILKTGMSNGIFFAITAMFISTNEIPSRMADQIKTVIPLKLNDKYMYSQILKTSSEKVIEISDVPGRGLIKNDEEIVEFQAYSILKTDDESIIDEEILEEINYTNSINSLVTSAMRVPIIPDKPTIKHLIKSIYDIKDKMSMMSNKMDTYLLPVGYEERSGKIYCLPVGKGINVVISGKTMTGKTEFLRTIEHVSRELGFTIEKASDEYEHLVISNSQFTTIVAVYEESYGFKDVNRWKEFIGNTPYVVHMGGCLDRTSVADFSYVPYLKQGVVKSAGRGTVRKNTYDDFYGDVIIARVD